MKRIAVYTAITGGYDHPRRTQCFSNDADFFMYSDVEYTKPTGLWELRQSCRLFKDQCRNAKIHKVLSHKYVGKYEYTLWIDGTMSLIRPVGDFIDHANTLADGNWELAVFDHKRGRSCVYKEAQVCKRRHVDSVDIIDEQMRLYTANGLKPDAGLLSGRILLRKSSNLISVFNEAWWAEICRFSRRDQLSLHGTVKRLEIPHVVIPSVDQKLFIGQKCHAKR